MEVKPIILNGRHISSVHLLIQQTFIVCQLFAKHRKDTDKQDIVFDLRGMQNSAVVESLRVEMSGMRLKSRPSIFPYVVPLRLVS